MPKFYLIERTYGPSVLHVFDTPADRDVKTMAMIFGREIENQDEAEQWDAYRAQLNDLGYVNFEGDPGLEWFTAIPA